MTLVDFGGSNNPNSARAMLATSRLAEQTSKKLKKSKLTHRSVKNKDEDVKEEGNNENQPFIQSDKGGARESASSVGSTGSEEGKKSRRRTNLRDMFTTF